MITAKYNRWALTFACFVCVLLCPFLFRLAGLQNFLSSPASVICSSLLLTLCWIINFQTVMKKSDFIVLFVTVIMVFITLIKNQDFGVIVTFYNITICSIILNNISFSFRQVKVIRLLAVILMSLLFASFTYTWQYNALWVYDGDTLINSNTYGILLLIFYLNLISLLDLFVNNSKIKCGLYFILTILALCNIWNSGCRSAIIAVAVFWVLSILKKLEYKKVLLALVIAGFVIPVIYIILSEPLKNFEFLGKSLFSGRQTVWLNVWNQIKTSPILGTGTESDIIIGNGMMTDSAHNIYLALWKTIGFVPMAAFIWFLCRGKNTGFTSSENVITKNAFLCCMVVCIVETLLNDNNYNYMVLLFLMNIENEPVSKEGFTNDTEENSLLLVWRQFLARVGKKMHSQLEKVLSRVRNH